MCNYVKNVELMNLMPHNSRIHFSCLPSFLDSGHTRAKG